MFYKSFYDILIYHTIILKVPTNNALDNPTILFGLKNIFTLCIFLHTYLYIFVMYSVYNASAKSVFSAHLVLDDSVNMVIAGIKCTMYIVQCSTLYDYILLTLSMSYLVCYREINK